MSEKQTKWTPGPWGIGTSADHMPAVTVPVHRSEGSGFVVAHINRLPRMGSVHGDMDANARLIAAAPDLYEALVQMVQTYWEEAKDYEPPPSMVQAAKRAIAKARGEA